MGSHVLLGLALAPAGSAFIATAHAAAALLTALYLVLKAPQRWAAAGAGYIVGAEVLWRMTVARVPWEFGKYAMCLVLAVALFRLGRRASWRWLPMTYLLLMLPSVIVLLVDLEFAAGEIFSTLSFNLSGPLSIALSVWCLSHVEMHPDAEDRALLAILAPLMTTGVVTFVRTLTTTDLAFTAESSAATSGGFGPNQVSVVLGLGAFVAFLYALRNRERAHGAMPALVLMLFMAMQTALTLSRGGLYGFAMAALATTVFLFRHARMRQRILWLAIPAALFAVIVVLPRLDAFTGGALVARFDDRQSSGRVEILKEDLRIWSEHPVLGAGPGGARDLRRTSSTVTHTEYSRLLAEHGLFGLVALCVLGLMSVAVIRRAVFTPDGATGAGLLVWSLASMSHAGMRMAAIGFIFGLAHARYVSWRSPVSAGSDLAHQRAPMLSGRSARSAKSVS